MCERDEDCPSETNLTHYSKCECVYSPEGNGYCNLHSGDDEWVTAHEDVFIKINHKFLAYYNATKNCHSSQRWGECDQPELYKRW